MMSSDAMEPRIVVLASGSGSNLQALIENTQSVGFPGRIVAVGCNRPGAFALERAEQAGIETFLVDHQQYSSREDFDRQLRQTIDRYSPDLLVLAGFMRILTPDFVRAFHCRMLNIHPSLLPKYRGLNTHQRALDDGEPLHGVTVHFVTEELDGGPLIAQAEVSVDPQDTAASLAEKVRAKEHLLYPIVVRWFCEGRLKLAGNQVRFDDLPLREALRLPVDLNS
ncbi:MAG: phosphoribosylglycinamide formyltransferase [Marinobacter sp.]|nr:phosphoribosylglycinamide formyltransferase [Marinobacter sp.]